jgi:hypothetical protein
MMMYTFSSKGKAYISFVRFALTGLLLICGMLANCYTRLDSLSMEELIINSLKTKPLLSLNDFFKKSLNLKQWHSHVD